MSSQSRGAQLERGKRRKKKRISQPEEIGLNISQEGGIFNDKPRYDFIRCRLCLVLFGQFGLDLFKFTCSWSFLSFLVSIGHVGFRQFLINLDVFSQILSFLVISVFYFVLPVITTFDHFWSCQVVKLLVLFLIARIFFILSSGCLLVTVTPEGHDF